MAVQSLKSNSKVQQDTAACDLSCYPLQPQAGPGQKGSQARVSFLEESYRATVHPYKFQLRNWGQNLEDSELDLTPPWESLQMKGR